MTTWLLILLVISVILPVLQIRKSQKQARTIRTLEVRLEDARNRLATEEADNEKLRQNNRSATKVWSSERQRISARARSAETHAGIIQEFHRRNEAELQHQLAGAHGVIELLMATFPKDYSVSPVPFEVQRIFRPVAQMATPDPNKQHPNVF